MSVVCSYVTSCLTEINLIIDLFWKKGYRHREDHIDMYRSLYVSATLYHR